MTKRRFSFSVLKYVHDALTGEFVNVGVIAYFPASPAGPALLKVATQRTIGRMRKMFPDLLRADFLSSIDAIGRSGRRIAAEVETDELGLYSDKDAAHFARRILVDDDSSLQWSALGGGVTEDPAKTFDRLVFRYVTRYDERSTARRSDEEVWKPVRQLLDERDINVPLEEKLITGDGDQVLFQHAWKNGVWHVYEPLSLDLADADGIAKKAHRWLGQMTSIGGNPAEPFHAHFLVGAPENQDLLPAYHRAIRILKKAPGHVDVFEEARINEFVNQIEDVYRTHIGSVAHH